MKDSRGGGTYLETLIALSLILVILNPLFFSLIRLKRGFNKISEFNRLESEIEKIRAYYKNPKNIDDFIVLDKSYKVEVKKRKIFEEIYCIEIKIEKNLIKRESRLYVYRQK